MGAGWLQTSSSSRWDGTLSYLGEITLMEGRSYLGEIALMGGRGSRAAGVQRWVNSLARVLITRCCVMRRGKGNITAVFPESVLGRARALVFAPG